MWPGELMGTKRGYTLPYNVVINKFMNYEGKKFSKSRNWTIDSKAFGEKYGIDLVRYAISANLPENKESDFTWKGFVEMVNNELVANFGNFINRTLKFFETKMRGEIKSSLQDIDPEVKKEIEQAFNEASALFEKAKISDAIQRVLLLSRFGNQYFDKSTIWQVIKTDEVKAKAIMINLLNIVFALNVLISPVTINASKKLTLMLSLEENWLEPEVGNNKWKFTPKSEFTINPPVEILFPKLDMEQVLREKV
jgi:methionyl-tRNA synthetase